MVSEFTTILALLAALGAFIATRRIKALTARITALEARLDAALPDAAVPDSSALQARDLADAAQDPDAQPDAKARRGWSTGPLNIGARFAGFAAWIRANWIYPMAGAALVMAAVFLVQYSIERGLLSPQARIGLALALGAALIGAGEAIRRRWGDEGSAAQMLPSTLSGAGIAALLAAILAAFHLYDMLSQGTALAALAVICAGAMVLGWLHGPLLAAIGILAGSAAPFLLGEGDAPMDMLYVYFGLIGVLGLGIDSVRRWGWVAALAVAAPMAGGMLIRGAGAAPVGLSGLALGLALLAMALPAGALSPNAHGARISQWRHARPEPVTVISALAVTLASAILVVLDAALVNTLALAAFALIVTIWTRRAPALSDQILIPVLALLTAVLLTGLGGWRDLAYLLTSYPWLPIAVVALAALAGAAMIWRSTSVAGGPRDFWALVGIGFPGATMVAFELFWQASTRIDSGTWAITAMALAAGYAMVALWAARQDAGQGLRLGGAAAASFAMIALALILTLSLSALTVALAVLMIAAAVLDRRFDLPLLGWFLVLGAMAMSWRIVVDPGISWLMGFSATGGASILEVWLSLLAALAGPGVALLLILPLARDKIRDWAVVFVETAFYGLIPIALVIVLARMLADTITLHAHLGIQATVLIALAWVQFQRAARFPDAKALRVVRLLLAVFFGLAAGLALLSGVFLVSPLDISGLQSDPIHGWPVLNDLILAYAAPGAVLAWTCRHRGARLNGIGRAVAAALLVLWGGMTVRHLWQGDSGMSLSNGFAQGELYAYTVALLVGGAVALALALRLRRTGLRIIGLVLIAIAAAKAFLIDAAGLTGLLRVGAFLALGLSLAGLAWLNAWVAGRVDDPSAAPDVDTPP